MHGFKLAAIFADMVTSRPRPLLRVATLAFACLLLPACDGALDDLRDLASSNIMYAPSSSMEPNIPTGSRFTVYEREAGVLRRGGVYIVQPNLNDPRILRLIGMPGDTVAVEDGAVVLNGTILRTEPQGSYSFETQNEGTKSATKLREFLPGDGTGHDLLDMGASVLDDFGPVTLGADQHFFLGDNRDNSADSRVPPTEEAVSGVGLVNADAITHRVDLDSVVE